MGNTRSTAAAETPMNSDELMRQMSKNTDVVIRFYKENEEFVEKYICENFWEEDVERWLNKIRQRSPVESLKVKKIEYLKAQNTSAHNTALYENTALVVRRAATFDLDVKFGNRAYDANRDDLVSIDFSVGADPSEATGTKIVCKIASEPGNASEWFCYTLPQKSEEPKTTSLRVNVPANAIVAKYAVTLNIVSGTKEGREETIHKDNSIIVLFNPFSKDDTVYMEDEKERNEYVLNDSGVIFLESQWRISPSNWDYAQFDAGVLEFVLLMLDNDYRHLLKPLKSWGKRHDPVYVSRVLSAMVNYNDDKGVLWGRWDGKYDDGKSPGFWKGSIDILKQWEESGLKPVKYGQCWVFAGVLATALRAVGIPARCITNFSSAHDTDANVTVDVYIDSESGDEIRTGDSVWNFHVWNEAFFRRPDLPEGFDGWQVVDATPQETSDIVDPVNNKSKQMFQCGPTPVKAVKEGEITIGYDTNFVFGEVNADKVTWFVKDRKLTGSKNVDKRYVGKFISTKAVGSNKRVDVTSEYKYAEGTEEERAAFKRAYGRGTRDHSDSFGGEGDLLIEKFEIEIDELNPAVGDDIATTIKIKNISEAKCVTNVRLLVTTKRHVGTAHAVVTRVKEQAVIEAGATHEIKLDIKQSEYMSKIVDNKVISLRVIATDVSDENTLMKEKDTTLVMPECITITGPTTVKRNEDSTFEVVFVNKLPITLTKGVFDVKFRGNIHSSTKTVVVGNPIPPNGTFAIKDLKVSPMTRWGRVTINVGFDSAEVFDITYKTKIEVE